MALPAGVVINAPLAPGFDLLGLEHGDDHGMAEQAERRASFAGDLASSGMPFEALFLDEGHYLPPGQRPAERHPCGDPGAGR